MKKLLPFIAFGMLSLAACESGEDKTQELQNHIIDSSVNARLSKRAADDAAKNDSILKVMEARKADTLVQEEQMQEKKEGATPNARPQHYTDTVISN